MRDLEIFVKWYDKKIKPKRPSIPNYITMNPILFTGIIIFLYNLIALSRYTKIINLLSIKEL